MTGIDLIAAERARQLTPLEDGGEGYGPMHDDGQASRLALAGASYALPLEARPPNGRAPETWPWAKRHWKPVPDDRIRELVKAGALIAAAIDSLGGDDRPQYDPPIPWSALYGGSDPKAKGNR